MSHYLTHLRFVHNVQTIICLTIIYLVWSSWTSGTELLGELNRFLRTTELAREVVGSPERISYLIPDIPSSRNSLRAEIEKMTGLSVSVNAPSMARSLTNLPNESAPIGVQWEQLQTQEWLRTTLGPSGDSLRDVGAWLNDRWRPCLRYLETTLRRARRDPRASRRLASREAARLMTPEVYFTVADWPESADTVSALVEVIVHLPQRYGSHGSIHNCRTVGNDVPDAGELTTDNDLGLFVERKTFGFRRLAMQTELVRIPPATFDDYLHLERDLEFIADLTPPAALNWAEDQQVAGIRGRDPRFLGTTIRGEHLGYVAPWAILFLHVYLLVNLRGLLGQIQNGSQVTTVLTWLAAMKQPLPILFSSITLVALPVVAAGFARWRLTPISWTGLFVWMVVLLGLGVGTMILAQSLHGRGDESLGAKDTDQG